MAGFVITYVPTGRLWSETIFPTAQAAWESLEWAGESISRVRVHELVSVPKKAEASAYFGPYSEGGVLPR